MRNLRPPVPVVDVGKAPRLRVTPRPPDLILILSIATVPIRPTLTQETWVPTKHVSPAGGLFARKGERELVPGTGSRESLPLLYRISWNGVIHHFFMDLLWRTPVGSRDADSGFLPPPTNFLFARKSKDAPFPGSLVTN